MTECMFKRDVSCENDQDDKNSRWLNMLATKVVLLVLTYTDENDGKSGRKNRNLDDEVVHQFAMKATDTVLE